MNRTQDSRHPAVAVAGVGTVHVAWFEWHWWTGMGDVWHSARDPAGTWSPVELLVESTGGDVTNPSMTGDHEGNVHLSWIDSSDVNGSGTDRDVYYKVLEDGTSAWSMPELVSWQSTENIWLRDFDVGHDGAVHVAWVENVTLFHGWRDPSTGDWSESRVLGSGSSDPESLVQVPSVGAGTSGEVHFAWSESVHYGPSYFDDVFATMLVPVPVASFLSNVTTVYEEHPVQFTFTGSEGFGTPAFEWDFGDGSVNSTDRDPVHVYMYPGEYTVTLVVVDQLGANDTITRGVGKK